MVNIDTTTPQLKAVKQIVDAITSRDLTTLELPFSKDFSFKTFPEAARLPSLMKEDYLMKHKAVKCY